MAVVVYDRDAPGGPYVHRVTTDLRPTAGGLPTAATPTGAVEYETSAGKPGWSPPCPTKNSGVHHYVFWVLALNRPTRVPTSVHTDNIVLNIAQAAIGQGTTTAVIDTNS